jgi:hypothetical protein
MEELRLRVFENRVLRRLFGPKEGRDNRGVEKLYNVERNDLYSSPTLARVIKSRRMRWPGHIARLGEGIGVYRVLVARLEGKRPLGRTRLKWEDNIKEYLQEVGCWSMDWIKVTQDRDRWRALVNAAMNLRVP